MYFREEINKERNLIKEELTAKGYANKAIGYAEFVELYKNYENIIDEKEFAKILGITIQKFSNLKNGYAKKTIILKHQCNEQERDKIITLLNEQGYTNKKIDYKQFLQLYDEYKNNITEKEFAEIIGITYPCYFRLKNGSKTMILHKAIDREKIRNEVETEYGSVFITYEQFLSIYQKYENQINDKTKFAEIIGITQSTLLKLKKGAKTKIFKRKKISKDIIENIRKIIISQEYENKMICYEEFLELYKQLGNNMTEVEFAEILCISYEKLYNMKKYNHKTVCLEGVKESIINISEIIEKLILKGYLNKKIDYNKFKRFV